MRRHSCWLVATVVLLTASLAAAAPVVFWASDPVRPGETVLLRGAGFGAQPTLEVARLADGPAGQPTAKAAALPAGAARVAALQPNPLSVRFTLPATLKPGLCVYRLTGDGGKVTGLLNPPTLWWAQGDQGPGASPGGELRLFGKNLSWGAGVPVVVRLQGPKTVTLAASGDAYAARVAIPRDLPAGSYQAFLHAGRGGSAGWSQPLKVPVTKPAVWPKTVYNVKDFGADGSGQRDDTAALQAALDKAGETGGGVVYLPRGRYQASATLTIPRFTVLRGERTDLACIFWPDVATPPKTWLTGTNSFGLEDLTLYCSNYTTFLAGDRTGPDAGDVFLRRLRVRANIYRGHMEPQEVDRRYREGLKVGFGGGYWLVALGGRNLEVSNCDLYSSSCVLSLTQPRGARITNNILGSGRWGGGGVFGGDGVIMEGNQYVGCDLMSWGAAGGLGYGNLQHVYLAKNSFALEHGGDREPITSDASGEVYSGLLAGADASSVTLPQPPKDTSARFLGAALYVVSGKGEGQWRAIAGFDGSRILVDRPWEVIPDDTSYVAVTFLLRQWLLLDNDFTDTGMAIQLYGAALEHICAGNKSTRTAGYHNFGMNYHGIQPSWYVQWLDNEILEGNIYSADHDNHRRQGDAHLGTYGLIGPQWKLPIVVGTIMRRNRLRNNASIVLGTELPNGKVTAGTRTDPLVVDSVVENNTIENANVGVYLFQTTRDTYLQGNRFRNVVLPLWDEALILQGEAARRKELLSGTGPLGAWDFSKAVTDGAGLIRSIPDTTGHGFEAGSTGVKLVDGRRGKAGQFDGQAYLQVNEPGLFNLQSVTVSLWIKPETVQGRHGLIGKRFLGTAAPYILSLWDGGLEFEGNDSEGKWSFNFRSPVCATAGEWQHVAAVVAEGKGVTLYRDGQVVGEKQNALGHTYNGEPLIIGREAWGGLPNQQDPPSFFKGLIEDVKVWPRALTADEVKAEAGR